MEDKGVLYIAMGDGFYEEAKISAESLKENNPGLQTCLITDKDREDDAFDEVRIEEPNEGSDKIQYMDNSPFNKTLLLDTDTLIFDDITELFDLLEQFDLAFAHNPKRISNNIQTGEKNTFEDVPKAFPELNGGVILFENDDKFADFAQDIREMYSARQEKYGKVMAEQPVFRKILYNSDMKFTILPPEYNCRLSLGGVLSEKMKIAHSRLIDLGGFGRAKKLNVRKAAKKINSVEGIRIFYYYKGGVKVKKRKEKISRMLTEAIDKYGIKGTAVRSIKKLKESGLATEF